VASHLDDRDEVATLGGREHRREVDAAAVVGSTDQVAGMGDRRWAELLATHDGLTRAEFERLRLRPSFS
jgi:hypothetical protein